MARMSFGRRTELVRHIRELAQRAEFLEAGTTAREQIEATLLAREIDKLYLLWGLLSVEGLDLDGEAATPEKLVDTGPEELCREALEAVKVECGLTDSERKN